ncbi:probable galacturonosyltransferase 7 isoform X2, partial [Tanacetum coccineum]
MVVIWNPSIRKSFGIAVVHNYDYNVFGFGVFGMFIYWAAFDKTSTYNKWILVSFDLITKEFKFIDLPHSLTTDLWSCSVSKLRESLVVYGSKVEGAGGCDVWVMEHDLSFKKLFSIGAQVNKILGFRESGEPIFETVKGLFNTLDVYDSCSQQINGLGIDGVSGTFSMGSYKESLLLLDHLDLHIYCD